MSNIKLGQVAGLRLIAKPSAVISFILLWIILSVVAIALFETPIGEAIVGGLVAAVLHYGGEIVHNLGHARAARQTGYPMMGVLLVGVLGVSLYPSDEPELPADVHIRRALGGPTASLLLTIIAAVIALLLRPGGGTPWLVAAFFSLENLLLFTLGAFIPLGFTDGSTLLKWRGKR